MKCLCALYFFFLLSFFHTLFGQQTPVPLHFKSIGINDGLSQGFVSDIIQDKQGFMWFATSDGLNKYDGYSFSVFRHSPNDSSTIGSDDLSYLFEDSRGRMWVATRNNGVDIFDQRTEKFYHLRHGGANSIASNTVYSISEDSLGALFITTNAGIDRMELLPKYNVPEYENFFDKYDIKVTHLIPDRKVVNQGDNLSKRIFTDKKGKSFVVIGQYLYGLKFTAYNKYFFSKIKRIAAAGEATVLEIQKGKISDNILIGEGDRIGVYDDSDWTSSGTAYEYKNKTTSVRVCAAEGNNRLWVNDGDALSCIDIPNRKPESYAAADSSQNEILRTTTCMFVDRTGVLWIGTGGYGILKSDPEIERFHHILPGTRQYQIREVLPGVVMTNNFQEISINRNHAALQNAALTKALQSKFLDHNVLHIASDTSGKIFIPDDNYIYGYDLKTGSLRSVYKVPGGIGPVFPLYLDKLKRLWFGIKNNFFQLLPNRNITAFPYPYRAVDYEPDMLQCIYKDGDVVWLGTMHGFFRFNIFRNSIDKSYFFRLNDDSSLSNDFVYCFCNDVRRPDRYLWIGTKGGGLNRMDKLTGKFIHYTTRNGLPNNVVYGILPGDDGNLWISTNKGLSAFDPETGVFRNYDEGDGLQSNEFNRYSYCKMSNGLLVFGGMNGVNYFDPKEIKPLMPPDVSLTEFRLFNKAMDINDPKDSSKENINFAKKIILRYLQNVITFSFAAMDYRREGNIHFRYKMAGFDKGWIYSGKIHEATYTNLNPGQYEFMVQGSFDNIRWGADAKTLAVTILTPWYMTGWFYLLLFLLASAIIYGLYMFRIRQIRKIGKLRNRIARDLHDEVGSSVSAISIYSKIIQEKMNFPDFDKAPLIDKINTFAREIMESMNDIVWNINTHNDSFERITGKMREYALQLLEPKGYCVHFDFDSEIASVNLSMERRKEFYLIYKEALNNTAKHAFGRNVHISLALSGNIVTLEIKDDGAGFDKMKIRENGNGLVNIKHRAKALNAGLSICSEIGKGTRLSLRFPLN